MKIIELLEAVKTGRKYQHIEDIVFTGILEKGINPGAEAGFHAVRMLHGMASTAKSLEYKWDGSPVVHWGRDNQGRFMMIPKNAWGNYLEKGKTEVSPGVPALMYSPNDVKKFILGTGDQDPSTAKKRKQFANALAGLWPYFEQISPQRGYLEGGILFSPLNPYTFNVETQEYEFAPNITAFQIPKNSKLGQRIGKAKMMVAVTGYRDTLGSSKEGRYPDAEKLSTSDVIVQGTIYVEQAPGIDSILLDNAEKFIKQNGARIDAFLAPKPGLSNVGSILYKFYNQNFRIEGVKQKFAQWAQMKLSAPQAKKIINDPNLDIVLDAVDLLSRAKMDIYRKASAIAHSTGIKQTKPEGFVYQDPETGQWVKAINQAEWQPRKD